MKVSSVRWWADSTGELRHGDPPPLQTVGLPCGRLHLERHTQVSTHTNTFVIGPASRSSFCLLLQPPASALLPAAGPQVPPAGGPDIHISHHPELLAGARVCWHHARKPDGGHELHRRGRRSELPSVSGEIKIPSLDYLKLNGFCFLGATQLLTLPAVSIPTLNISRDGW